MSCRSRRLRLLVVVAALSPLLIVSCGEDSTKPEEPLDYPTATTLDQLLSNFRASYTHRDSEEYAKLLDGSFRFVFDPNDITEEQPKPFYSRGDELASIERLFGGEPDAEGRVVSRIQFAFQVGEPVVSPQDPAWTKVTLSNFEMEVRVTEGDTGQLLALRTAGGYLLDLHAAEVDTVSKLWKIMELVDRPPTTAAGGPSSQPITLGAFKAGFHPEAIPYPQATTIDQLLDNFYDAIVNMNYREYAALLDLDYEFVFDPRDITEENPTGVWFRFDDLESMRRLFRGEPDDRNRVAQSIRLHFIAGDPVDSDEGEGWKKVVLSSFEMEIEAIQTDNGETWFLRTQGGYALDLYVKEVSGGPAVWKIVRIVDRPPETARGTAWTEEATWGAIKLNYR